MSKLILRLVTDSKTGQQELSVDYESDGDRLPFEHEEEHRQWIQKVLGGENQEFLDNLDLNIERENPSSKKPEEAGEGLDRESDQPLPKAQKE